MCHAHCTPRRPQCCLQTAGRRRGVGARVRHSRAQLGDPQPQPRVPTRAKGYSRQQVHWGELTGASCSPSVERCAVAAVHGHQGLRSGGMPQKAIPGLNLDATPIRGCSTPTSVRSGGMCACPVNEQAKSRRDPCSLTSPARVALALSCLVVAQTTPRTLQQDAGAILRLVPVHATLGPCDCDGNR
jgi:hypothetical protein